MKSTGKHVLLENSKLYSYKVGLESTRYKLQICNVEVCHRNCLIAGTETHRMFAMYIHVHNVMQVAMYQRITPCTFIGVLDHFHLYVYKNAIITLRVTHWL